MVFSSLVFLFLFLPIVIGIYYLIPSRTYKNLWLFITSLFFYAWGEPIYISIMIVSIFNDFFCAQLVEKERNKGNLGKAKFFFVLSIGINLGLLFFFKYAGFVIENVNAIFHLSLSAHTLPLPIGISFYTFQTMSYSIDVYMGHVKVQKNFLTMAAYVTMFPQLIAGPIVRYITVEEELTHRTESIELASYGLRRFIIGLGKKVIIANQMGMIADTIYNSAYGTPGTIMLWLAAVAYTFQIYFDFSGYSDMAIGLGRMFGFHFLENFNYPYISTSVTDFWRRWHISLSTWFKDYVYIPLGGNRKWIYRNILIVWMLTGLWHGASWNYVFWGLYYGVLLIAEKLIMHKVLNKLPKVIRHIYTLLIVVVGWVIFRLEDASQLFDVLKGMVRYSPTSRNDLLFIYQDMLYALPFLILAIFASTPIAKQFMDKIESKDKPIPKVLLDICILGILLISIVFLVGEKFNPFIYFRF
ncbi:MBOAT family O-acyltransferase [Fusibacter bizertensis]